MLFWMLITDLCETTNIDLGTSDIDKQQRYGMSKLNGMNKQISLGAKTNIELPRDSLNTYGTLKQT